ncbi:MAG: hypothetical protein JO036_16055 [Candidatus Eremiobacteraeota bacterium]|nr:hypothetical protein [Candidatus Eremiobacteraeota bacterium]
MNFDDTSPADATALYQPNDMIALRMGQLAATRVTEETLRRFRADLDRLSRRGNSRYFRLWDTAFDAGPESVRRALTEPSQRGQVMRSLISFRAFVTKAERDAIVSENVRAVTANWSARHQRRA